MTKDEAIELLEDLDGAIEDNHGRDYDEAFRMAIKSLSAEPKWIPVSEKLPKTGDSVLVTYSDGEVAIIWSARPEAWVRYIESNNLIYPIAWMPLPTPYKGGDEE